MDRDSMRPRNRFRPKLRVPEPLDLTIDRAGGPAAPWAKPAVRESIWRDAVGRKIADRARPVELARGTLLIRVATSVWANELSLLSEQLIQRLRERGVQVRTLRFRVGPIEQFGGTEDPRRKSFIPPAIKLPALLEGAIAGVADEELRKEIAGAARANLAWQGNMAPRTRATSGRRDARGLRDAGTESARPDPAWGASDEASRHTLAASPRRPK
jgi:hypothetical protein